MANDTQNPTDAVKNRAVWTSVASTRERRNPPAGSSPSRSGGRPSKSVHGFCAERIVLNREGNFSGRSKAQSLIPDVVLAFQDENSNLESSLPSHLEPCEILVLVLGTTIRERCRSLRGFAVDKWELQRISKRILPHSEVRARSSGSLSTSQQEIKVDHAPLSMS